MVRVSLRPEAVPPLLMEAWGGASWPALADHEHGRGAILAKTPTRPARSASPSPRRSRTPRRAMTPSTRSARCSITCCCTRPSSGRRRSSSLRWPATIPTSSSGAPAAARTSPASRSRSSPTSRAGMQTRIVAVEPAACPSLTRGKYAYDFGDTAHLTPLVKMHTLGTRLHAAGDPRRRAALPRHGAAGLSQGERPDRGGSPTSSTRFAAGAAFAAPRGILPAPEPAHAIRAAIDEALAAKEAGEARVILFNLCGHGHFDLSGPTSGTWRGTSRTTNIRSSGSTPPDLTPAAARSDEDPSAHAQARVPVVWPAALAPFQSPQALFAGGAAVRVAGPT